MSNAVTKVDTAAIGAHEAREEKEVTAEQANAAARLLNLPEGFAAIQTAHATLGKFASAAGISGYVIARGVWTRAIIEKVVKKLADNIENSYDEEAVSTSATALAKMLSVDNAISQSQMQATEIVAHGSKKKSQKSQAPQMLITGDNNQIVGTAISPAKS